jgi:hypothetical protein
MVRIKKLALAALVAFALAAGGLTFAHEPPPTDPDPVAFSWGESNSGSAPEPEPEQIASSAGGRARIARESS